MDTFDDDNIKYISIYDGFYPNEEYPTGNLKLRVSKDDNIYFDKDKCLEDRIANNMLMIRSYEGEIYIPKRCSLIINASRSIEGKISSPSYISSEANVDLVIDEKSLLELSYIGYGPLRLNGKVFSSGIITESGAEAPLPLGRDFYELRQEYYRILGKSIKNPQVMKDEFGEGMDFSEAKFEAYPIEVCRYFNLVHIDKSQGASNIYYHGPLVGDGHALRSRNTYLEKKRKQEELLKRKEQLIKMDTTEGYLELRKVENEISLFNKKFENYKKKIIKKQISTFDKVMNGEIEKSD